MTRVTLSNYVLVLVTASSFLFSQSQPVHGGGCEKEVLKNRVSWNLRRTEALLLRHSAREADDERPPWLSAAIDHVREAQHLARSSRSEEALRRIGRLVDYLYLQIEHNGSVRDCSLSLSLSSKTKSRLVSEIQQFTICS